MLLIASSQSPTVNKPQKKRETERQRQRKRVVLNIILLGNIDYTIGQTTICFSLQVENRKLMRSQKIR